MPAKPSKADIGLYLTPDVLRLPYAISTRIVYAEVLSLSASCQTCNPRNAHFHERFGLSADTVTRSLKELETAGLLTIDQDPQTGHNRTLTLPQNAAGTLRKMRRGVPQNAVGASAKCGSMKSTSKSTKKSTPPYPPQSAASRRVGGADFQSEKDPQRTEPGTEQGTEQNAGERAPAEGGRKAGGAAGTSQATPPPAPMVANTAGFAAFWEAWPTKQRRKDAATAFGALADDDQHHATERAARWLREHPRQVERGAVPFPASWLSGEMWHDGPEPPDKRPKPGQTATSTRTTRRITNPDDLR